MGYHKTEGISEFTGEAATILNYTPTETYRSTSVGSTGIPANLWVGICNLEYGNFSFYTDNGIDFTVWDPE